MDPIGGLAARLDERAPRWAERLRWYRARRRDVCLQAVEVLVARGDHVIDIGAMRGLFTARMLDLVGPGGRVHAFEPNPAHRPRMEALAKSAQLSFHPAALSDRSGDAVLLVPSGGDAALSGCASLEHAPAETWTEVRVPAVTLDEIIGDVSPISFIKCDVEGHEDSVIRGAQRLLERCRPTVLIELEERHRSRSVSAAIDCFIDLGYHGFAAFPEGLRPVRDFDVEDHQHPYLECAAVNGVMPEEYVHNFLFAERREIVEKLGQPTFALASDSAQ